MAYQYMLKIFHGSHKNLPPPPPAPLSYILNVRSLNAKQKKTQYSQSMIHLIHLQLLTRPRLQFSHLNEHKFIHRFRDTINAMCACGSELETTEHFFLRCHLYSPQTLELFENLEKVDSSFLNLKSKEKVSFFIIWLPINNFQKLQSRNS